MNKFRNMILGLTVCAGLPLIASTGFAQSNKSLEQRLAAMEQQVFIQQGRIAALEAKLKYLTVDGTNMIIAGANLQLCNGTGNMGNTNGLGNLTIGYNDNTGFNERTGSHNLLMGRYLSYTAYGSILSGENNRAEGDYSTILGSYQSHTSGNGDSGTIISTVDSSISKDHSAIVASSNSQVNAWISAVVGGESNVVDANFSVINGGKQNKIWFTTTYGAMLGGYNNQIWKGSYNSITGGYNNQVYGYFCAISGGSGGIIELNVTAGSITGGDQNTVLNNYSTIGGGHNLSTTSNMQFKGGGLTG